MRIGTGLNRIEGRVQATAGRIFDLVEASARVSIAEDAVAHAGQLADGADGLPERLDLGLPRQQSWQALIESSRLEQTRPELSRARAELDALRAEEEQTKWGWALPKVVVSASFGGLGFNYADLHSRERYAAALRWDLGAQLFGDRQRTRSMRRQAELVAARTRAEVVREIGSAGVELLAAELELEVSAEEVAAAGQALELATRRHQQGAALLIEVLEAQVAASRALASQVDALVSFNRAQYSLWRATGFAGRS